MSSGALGTGQGLSCGIEEKVWGRQGCVGLQGTALSAGWRSQTSLGTFLVVPTLGLMCTAGTCLVLHTDTHSCVNLHMKRWFFSLYFLERNPPALHGLVWGQPTQTALSTHTCACVLTFELPCTCGCSPCSCPTPEHWQSPVAPTQQTGVSQRQTHPLARWGRAAAASPSHRSPVSANSKV